MFAFWLLYDRKLLNEFRLRNALNIVGVHKADVSKTINGMQQAHPFLNYTSVDVRFDRFALRYFEHYFQNASHLYVFGWIEIRMRN
jgi:hypothetical protein